MYGKTGNFSHFRTRSASHSTKGSARGVIWIIPRDAESVVEASETVPADHAETVDTRVEASTHKLKILAHNARKRIARAHASGDAKEMARAKRQLKLLCGLAKGVKMHAVGAST